MTNFLSKANPFSHDRRRPAFAGTWYESEPERLRKQLDEYLNKAEHHLAGTAYDASFTGNKAPATSLLAIIVPHAGYMFSGQTAAFAYDVGKKQKIERVFILGPSHYVGFQGCALPSEKIFATPLGDLNVDMPVLEELRQYPMFEVMPEVHRREHSLELQLPFIKQSFGDVKIVPLILGSFNDDTEIRLTAQILRRYIKTGDLIVVSSDFTHYGPRYQYEPFETNIRENVRKLDEEAYSFISSHDLDGFISFRERTQDTICGFFPCSVLMALLPETAFATVLNYRTSQDVLAEDDRNSVSYFAIAVSDENETAWAQEPEDDQAGLSDDEKQALLNIARSTLEKFVRERVEPSASEFAEMVTPKMRKFAGAFVTLYRCYESGAVSREDKELRGCIGYIWPVKPLVQAVIENVIGAAFRDYRFRNVGEDELETIRIDINVLTAPKRIPSYEDIVVGRDGVVLYKNGKQAVFLPSVATEFGWDLEQTLSQLSMKAGCGADGWKHGAQFDVFQSESFEEH